MVAVPEQIEREVLIDAAPSAVWAAITEPEHIGQWFPNAGTEVDLRPGGALRFSWHNGDRTDTMHGVVEKLDPPHLFAYRWATPPGTLPNAGNSTMVEFTLMPEGAGTRLKVVESGFRELEMSERERAHTAADHADGWHRELDELHDYVTGAM
jgi:uncharacterized protein YndB with AHSA1/START domain